MCWVPGKANRRWGAEEGDFDVSGEVGGPHATSWGSFVSFFAWASSSRSDPGVVCLGGNGGGRCVSVVCKGVHVQECPPFFVVEIVFTAAAGWV